MAHLLHQNDYAILSFCIIQTLTISMESKIPKLSMSFTTSDENTPSNIIQLDEYISVNVSITLPEVCI